MKRWTIQIESDEEVTIIQEEGTGAYIDEYVRLDYVDANERVYIFSTTMQRVAWLAWHETLTELVEQGGTVSFDPIGTDIELTLSREDEYVTISRMNTWTEQLDWVATYPLFSFVGAYVDAFDTYVRAIVEQDASFVNDPTYETWMQTLERLRDESMDEMEH